MKKERPRTYNFSINGKKFEKSGNYEQQKLRNGDNYFSIEDPLKVSIGKFISSLNKKAPLISSKEILKNVKIQEEILEEISQCA